MPKQHVVNYRGQDLVQDLVRDVDEGSAVAWQAAADAPRRAAMGLALAATVLTAPATSAALLLTEINYNGPGPGSDPDEFVEISNAGDDPIDLTGYRFSAGINADLSAANSLQPGASLVIARDPEAFLGVFPAFAGDVLDFSGALSNGGELLGLEDGAGLLLWSVNYDDSSPWPESADGGGDSLQLLATATAVGDPSSWTAAPPTPGSWSGASTGPGSGGGDDGAGGVSGPPRPTASVPLPSPAWLLATALPLVWRRQRAARLPPVPTAGGLAKLSWPREQP